MILSLACFLLLQLLHLKLGNDARATITDDGISNDGSYRGSHQRGKCSRCAQLVLLLLKIGASSPALLSTYTTQSPGSSMKILHVIARPFTVSEFTAEIFTFNHDRGIPSKHYQQDASKYGEQLAVQPQSKCAICHDALAFEQLADVVMIAQEEKPTQSSTRGQFACLEYHML